MSTRGVEKVRLELHFALHLPVPGDAHGVVVRARTSHVAERHHDRIANSLQNRRLAQMVESENLTIQDATKR